MRIGVKLKGIRQFNINIHRTMRQIEEGVKDTNAIIANKIKGDAQRNVPVFQGNLRKSIKIKTMNTGKKFVVRIGSTSKYASKIEFGYSGLRRLPNINKIRQWVTSKGLPDSMVMPLAKKLKRIGSSAQPYLVPSFDKYISKYETVLKFRLSRIT